MVVWLVSVDSRTIPATGSIDEKKRQLYLCHTARKNLLGERGLRRVKAARLASFFVRFIFAGCAFFVEAAGREG
jgi:hypothetical protein